MNQHKKYCEYWVCLESTNPQSGKWYDKCL